MEAELAGVASRSGAEGPPQDRFAGGSIEELCAGEGVALLAAGFDVKVTSALRSRGRAGRRIVVQGN